MGSRASMDGSGNSRPTGFRYLDCPARSELLYGLSYPGVDIGTNRDYSGKIMNPSKLMWLGCGFVWQRFLCLVKEIKQLMECINPLKPELNPICYLLALLGSQHFLHVSRIRVKSLTFRRLMSYIYGAPILDVSRSHSTTQHSR